VQPDLAAGRANRLDELRSQLGVALRCGAVVRVVVSGEDEEGRAGCSAAAFLCGDLLEPPVRVGAAQPVPRCDREAGRFAHRRTGARLEDALLDPGGSAADADARPAPRRVDVVREGDGEGRRIDTEPAAEPFQRRIEWVEARPLRAEAAVLVARAVALLDTRQVEEPGGKIVGGALAAVDLLPGCWVVGNVVAEADVAGPDRVEHPAGAAFDRVRNHRRGLRT